VGVESELVKGSGGIFDVEVDGQLIFSKHETNRFPEHAEILNQLLTG
jgi:selenoprotein W-related protein